MTTHPCPKCGDPDGVLDNAVTDTGLCASCGAVRMVCDWCNGRIHSYETEDNRANCETCTDRAPVKEKP